MMEPDLSRDCLPQSSVRQSQHLPAGFVVQVFERSFEASEEEIALLWMKLNRRETFTQGQLFPYRVEFDAPAQTGEFAPGELTIHHGPLLSAHGAIREVTPKLRGLDYGYGSYVLSFRLVRPQRLEFTREGGNLRVRLTVQTKRWFAPLWTLGNRMFWSLFKISL